MPRQYEAIRDGLLAIGYDRKAAQAKAAAIYNAQHPDQPVTGHNEQRSGPPRGKALPPAAEYHREKGRKRRI